MIPIDFQKKHNEARELFLSNDFAQALPRYEKLTRQCPGMAVLWAEYGNAASRLRQVDLAGRAWQKAISLDLRNADLIGMIGHQYQGLRQPEKARACFAQAAAADPRGINPRISLAVLLEQQHHLNKAREAVDECLAIDPSDDQGAPLFRRSRSAQQIGGGRAPFARSDRFGPEAPIRPVCLPVQGPRCSTARTVSTRP